MAMFTEPQVAKDQWTVKLYAKHGLGENPTMEAIEPKAIELLAELVLGRRVDGKESMGLIVLLPFASVEQKIGMLLLRRATEDLMLRKI